MEIRVLRAVEVRQLLPMPECIDLMHRTMIAVSERRVVLPLRSVMVMPGERGMLGNMPGYLKRASVGFYSQCLMFDELGRRGMEADRPSVFLPVDGTAALAVLIGGTVALLAFGMILFSRSQYHEVD